MKIKLSDNKKRLYKTTLKDSKCLPDGPAITNGHWLISMATYGFTFCDALKLAPDGKWSAGEFDSQGGLDQDRFERVIPSELTGYVRLEATGLAEIDSRNNKWGSKKPFQYYHIFSGKDFLVAYNADYLRLFETLEIWAKDSTGVAVLKCGDRVVGGLMPIRLGLDKIAKLERMFFPESIAPTMESEAGHA